jgi:hypothetical protein
MPSYGSGAPDRFLKTHDESSTSLKTANQLLTTDPELAERLLVKLYKTSHEKEPKLFDLLEKTYERLGWSRHAHNLKHTSDG